MYEVCHIDKIEVCVLNPHPPSLPPCLYPKRRRGIPTGLRLAPASTGHPQTRLLLPLLFVGVLLLLQAAQVCLAALQGQLLLLWHHRHQI
jgi:hypothetical protein